MKMMLPAKGSTEMQTIKCVQRDESLALMSHWVNMVNSHEKLWRKISLKLGVKYLKHVFEMCD